MLQFLICEWRSEVTIWTLERDNVLVVVLEMSYESLFSFHEVYVCSFSVACCCAGGTRGGTPISSLTNMGGSVCWSQTSLSLLNVFIGAARFI